MTADRRGGEYDALLADAIAVLTAAARLTRPVRRLDTENTTTERWEWIDTGDTTPVDWAEFVTLALAGAAANMRQHRRRPDGTARVLGGRRGASTARQHRRPRRGVPRRAPHRTPSRPAMTAAPGTGWMTDAACATAPHRGLPWLDATHTMPAVLVDVMGDVCAGCPVLAACAGYVSAESVTGGFWAGADRDPAAAVMQLDLNDLLEPVDRLGGAA